MKILAIGDFHGKFPDKLKKKIMKEKPDCILSIGDYGDSIEYRKLVFANWYALEKISLENLIGKERYNRLIKHRKNSAKKVIKELDSLGITVYSITGNGESIEKFKIPELKKIFSKLKNIELVYNKSIDFNGWQILGICSLRGASSKLKTAKSMKRKTRIMYKNTRWNFILKKLFSKMENPKKTIFLAHEPPKDTKLDIINYPESPLHGTAIGDEYFRKYVEKHQPALMVCGHFHENQGTSKLGKTLIVNCGAAQNGEAAIIDIGKTIRVKLIKV